MNFLENSLACLGLLCHKFLVKVAKIFSDSLGFLNLCGKTARALVSFQKSARKTASLSHPSPEGSHPPPKVSNGKSWMTGCPQKAPSCRN